MTALWCDGFDGYTDITQKYTPATYVAIGATSGRYGTAGISFTTGSQAVSGILGKPIDASSALVAGIAWYGNSASPHTTSSLGTDYIMAFYSGATLQVALSILSDGTLVVHNGSTVLGQSTNAIELYNWYYIELKSAFGASAEFKVRVTLNNDNSSWIIGTGNTDSASSGTANVVRLGSLCEPNIDDYYIVDELGTYNNNFLGDSRVLSLLPTSDGTYTQWTPSSGSFHYSLINEVPADITTYVSSTSGSNTDTYYLTTQDSFLKEADFIQQCFYVSVTSGSANLTPVAYVNGHLYGNPVVSVPVTAAYRYSIWENRPDSGTQWTGNSLNNNQFGFNE